MWLCSDAFDNCMAAGILRLQGGLDFSEYVEEVGDYSEKPTLSGCFDACKSTELWTDRKPVRLMLAVRDGYSQIEYLCKRRQRLQTIHKR